MSSVVDQSWWTPAREARWERLDDAARAVAVDYASDGTYPVGGLSIHASAPNPDGITADITPDAWYCTLPYEEGRVDVESIAAALARELDASVTATPRSDDWGPGTWLIVGGGEWDE